MSSNTAVPAPIPMRSPEFLIEGILPSREVHLIGGPSGAGKTTWLFQILKDQWRQGGVIMGRAVRPVPYVYVSADRSKEGVKRTMYRAGINYTDVSFMSLMNFPGIHSVTDVVDKVLQVKPDAKLFFIDGVMGLLPPRRDSNSDGGFKHISQFLASLCMLCQTKDITIVLIVHSPKQKEDSRYTNPRERVMGSAAWAAFSETVFLIEPFMPVSAETAHKRTLICLPRNESAQFVNLEFNSNGRLVESNEELDSTVIELWLAQNRQFTTAQFEVAMRQSMSKASCTRWLKKLVDQGTLVKEAHGRYRRAAP